MWTTVVYEHLYFGKESSCKKFNILFSILSQCYASISYVLVLVLENVPPDQNVERKMW